MIFEAQSFSMEVISMPNVEIQEEISSLLTYQQMESRMVCEKEDIHDAEGIVDFSKVFGIAISKYGYFPYKLDGIGKHAGDYVFIKE